MSNSSAANTPARHMRSDLLASLVVFLVALPLSVGIAFASGAPIMAGIISAIIGGVVVGLFSGAPLQVSGPAAGLTVLVFANVQQLGFATTCVVTAAAGLLQIVLGRFGVARVTMAIPPAVIHGMLAGIGVLITLGQVHVVLGGDPQSSALKNLAELPDQLSKLHSPAVLIGGLTIATLVVWPRLSQRLGPAKMLPAPLVAVALGTTASMVLGLDLRRVTLEGSLLESLRLPPLPAAGQLGAILVGALTMCVIASAESLLCAVATDKLHHGPRANLDRELTAQGIGNTVAGLIGGLPVTGVIVRSSANITSGAKTRLSAILHGLWILLFVSQLGFLVAKIPLAVLAGLLVHVGGRLVDAKHIKELVHHKEIAVYLATVLGVVFVNLLAGIGIGIALSLLRLLARLVSLDVHIQPTAERQVVRIDGALTFVGIPKLNARLASVPSGHTVELDLAVSVIDHAGYEAITTWRAAYERGGGKVQMEDAESFWSRRAPA